MTDLSNTPSLVILIDCWTTSNADNVMIMDRIVNFCLNSSGPQAVALASYASLRGEEVIKEEPWFSNSKALFYDRVRWEPLREVWDRTHFIDNPGPDSHTYFSVLDIPDRNRDPNKNFFIIWHHDQLAYYLNYIRPSIRTLILAGFAWKQCLKWRTMGHEHLSRLVKYKIIDPGIKILTNKHLVGCVPGETFEIYKPWQDLGDDWYGVNFDLLEY